jgi:regulator of ribonuclease activity A
MKTSDLCDQHIDRLNVAEPIGFKSFGGKHEFHGRIETVKCFEDNTFVRATLEKDGTGKVLVVDGGGSKRCALLGDHIAELAHQNNWNGVIVHGSIRDSAAVSKIDIGVLALGTNPKKSAKNREGTVGIPIHFAGLDFIPGEFVYVDEDGMVISGRELK